MNRTKNILFFLILVTSNSTFAQDPQFTQFYAAPTYLNPAFAGTSTQSRFSLNYRNQWPAISKSFVTYNASYDHYVAGINSGIGVMLTHDRAGTGALQYTNIAVQYAYEVRLTRKISLRPALQAAYTIRNLDFNRLTFGDQLLRDNASSSIDPNMPQFSDRNVVHPDFSSGILLYSEKYWLGISAHHLNRPNQSLVQNESRLPIKYSVHGGWRQRTNSKNEYAAKQHIVTAFNYKAQGDFDQLDVGVYYEYEPVTFGVWYRGLPGLKKNDANYVHHDALALMVGVETKGIYIGYSYDLTISHIAANTGGSHEISLISEFASKRNKKSAKRRVIPCAKF